MATFGRTVTEQVRRRLRGVETRLGLTEPDEGQFWSFFVQWIARVAHLAVGTNNGDNLKTFFRELRDGERRCEATTYSEIVRYLYAHVLPWIDEEQRREFRRETERLWLKAMTELPPGASEAQRRKWESETWTK